MAQTIPKTINVKRWANDMADWKNSGLTQKEWCQLHQVNLHTFKYHLKQVRAAIAAHQAETAQYVSQSPESSALTTQFAKVPLTALRRPDQTQQGMARQAAITVTLKTATVNIMASASPAQIQAVLMVMSDV